jgi:hypothetical protein
MPFSIRLIFAGLHSSTPAASAVLTPAASRSRRSSDPARRDRTVGLPPEGIGFSLHLEIYPALSRRLASCKACNYAIKQSARR